MNNQKTTISCPTCGTQFSISEETINTIRTASDNINTKPKRINMTAQEKLKALKEAGVDTSKLFCMSQDGDSAVVVRMTLTSLNVVEDDDPIFRDILKGEVIKNSKLYRRWVMAQVFRMLSTGNFNKALQDKGYLYQWKMVMNELHAQEKMVDDAENLHIRSIFFNSELIYQMTSDYIRELKRYVLRNTHNIDGKEYVKFTKSRKWVELSDVQDKICQLIALEEYVGRTDTISELCDMTYNIYRLVLATWFGENDMSMNRTFKDMYRGAGGYYTMQNLINFHGCRFIDGQSREDAISELNAMVDKYKDDTNTWGWDWGYRIFGAMKEMIANNNIDINQKLKEWRKA